ncbi:hypothetical protein BCR35DRAFT_304532 [Leucosporidium creatinivorum]|uniref:Nascent polypeptide-associated complex subunit alpha-like UBA domain-containing protein n=1 Tax=Leucosporidium creatinivorum TaxID=106004 RepID=A0A1Y2F749_9BASI|nr:hypothetical protein BCR35DRAFT_304532 [Leucosporidium creatinivorum]
MLKAKAKAAATAAKAAKAKKAAEEAARLKAAEAAEAAAAGVPVVSTRRGAATMATRGRPAVTQYWVDHQSSQLAPNGGGILRIGYDQAAFEEGVREVILEPRGREEWEAHKRRLALGEDVQEEQEEKKVEQATEEKKVEQPAGAPVNKDHVAFIVSQLDLPDRLAKAALRRHSGDVVLALRDLTAPALLDEEAGVRSGRPAGRLVVA